MPQTLSREEREALKAEVSRRMDNATLPRGPIRRGQEHREAEEDPRSSGGSFDPASLPLVSEDDLYGEGGEPVWLELVPEKRRPDGTLISPAKGGWVHPLSLEDVEWLNAQARLKVEATCKNASAYQQQLAQRLWATVFQSIACLKDSQDPEKAQRLFGTQHAKLFYQNKGIGHERLRQAVQISDQLSGEGDGALSHTEGLRGFLLHTLSLLGTLSSPSTTVSPASCTRTLAAYGSYVGRILLQGTLSLSDLEDFPEVVTVEGEEQGEDREDGTGLVDQSGSGEADAD